MVDRIRTAPLEPQPQNGSRSGKSLRRQTALLGVSAAAVAMLAIPATARSAQLVWNTSASAPAGVYSVERSGWEVGDRVVVLPSPELAEDLENRGILPRGKLLIKTLAASARDTVCRHQEVVTVNGRAVAHAKLKGSDGVALPSWQGCVTLTDRHVFLLGEGANSYDGRYFGATSTGDIVGRAAILMLF